LVRADRRGHNLTLGGLLAGCGKKNLHSNIGTFCIKNGTVTC
jgi:hypothetical protein